MQPRLVVLTLIVSLALLAACMPVQPQAPAVAADITSAAWKIQNALSAAPVAVSKDAAVLDWPAGPDAKPVELRPGTNNWVCRPDDPVSPANDPRCFDPNWRTLAGTQWGPDRAALNAFGIGYMLQAGAIADNADPSVLTPVEGNDWLVDGPHVMINVSKGLDITADYMTHHGMGMPFVMFDNATGEHVMIPIRLNEVMPSTTDPIRNAMSAGPIGVSEHATILDWPAEAGGDWVELRAGNNGWTCITDGPGTPTNDPMCLDANWMEFVNAQMAGRPPVYTDVGIGYMLQGESSASRTDPMLMEPPAGQAWSEDGPHFMVVAPWDLDPAVYSVDAASGKPYIMWEGTPYEHLMVPVTDMPAK